jgi:hypothetical protein
MRTSGPVGLEESQRKSDWVRAEFEDFESQSYSIGRKSGEIYSMPHLPPVQHIVAAKADPAKASGLNLGIEN